MREEWIRDLREGEFHPPNLSQAIGHWDSNSGW
jgi:hypothetical protein